MKDIEKAIEIEKTYLEHRMKGEYPFHLVDKVKECGFESLDEYFEAKKKYRLNKLDFEFIEQEPITGILKCIELFSQQKAFVLFANSDIPFVFLGENGVIDSEYCNKNNIPIVPIFTGGGSIVNLEGDFSFAVCCPVNIIDDANYILKEVSTLLQKYTDKEIAVDGNDILIDGKKVCGSATYKKHNYFMFVGYFSFSDKTDLISNICKTTKTGKDVGYIDFINRDAFRKEVSEWLKVHSI